jgi:alanine racemase
MSYTDLNRIEIDLMAVRHNFNVLDGLLKSTGARIMAVVKSDAYGHGLSEKHRGSYHGSSEIRRLWPWIDRGRPGA